jgi:RIO kinase 1
VREHGFPDVPDFHDFDDDSPRFARTARRQRPRLDDEPAAALHRGRLTESARARLAAAREDAYAEPELPLSADRRSTWGEAEHGPHPRPDWVITDLAAVDVELGVLKTGKEADVHLLRRAVPNTTGTDTDRSVVLAAKRYRGADHRLFHRDAGYLEGRQVRRSRENRAMANRSAFGRNLISEQWATAEFAALSRLWRVGAPVPYPVQRVGTELLLEFLGDESGAAAPRLAQLRPEPDQLVDLWEQLVAALELMARAGLAHGDLSAYNLLVHEGHLMLIDLPQVVDVVANPRGPEFLARDVRNVADWFAARGLPADLGDPEQVVERLRDEAGLT